MTLLTEDEAKRTWCPLARAVDLAGSRPVAANRNRTGPDIDCMCIASACMAWRHEMTDSENGEGGRGLEALYSPPPKIPSGRGYCGAFGKPS